MKLWHNGVEEELEKMKAFRKIMSAGPFSVVRNVFDIQPVPWPKEHPVGETHELFVLPAGTNLKNGSAALRVSVATWEEQDTTFSTYPEYNRAIILVSGQPFVLRGDRERELVVGRDEASYYAGRIAMKCQLQAPGERVYDLNVIYKVNKVNPRFSVVTDTDVPFPFEGADADLFVVLCAEGGGNISLLGRTQFIFQPFDYAILQKKDIGDVAKLNLAAGRSRFIVARLRMSM